MPQRMVVFHGEIIYFDTIAEAMEHAYRRGRHEGYGEGYNDARAKPPVPHDVFDLRETNQ